MANFDIIHPQLATGGDLGWGSEALDNLEALVAAGVTHVVDNRIEASDERLYAAHAPHIHYLNNGVDDAGQRMPDEWFERAVDFSRRALAEPGALVLTHCHMGINRGPSSAYRILLDQGWDPVEALVAVRTARPIAWMAYALDALDHHHRGTGVDDDQRMEEQLRVRRWLRAHDFDVTETIRGVRLGGAA